MATTRLSENLPHVEYLRECFDLDAETGTLTWKTRPREHFDSDISWKSGNIRAGGAAGSAGNLGYYRVHIQGRKYLAHRVVWALHYGVWPSMNLDHINGDKGCNAVANLREVSTAVNNRGAAISSRNTSGVVGVTYRPSRNKWEACIWVDYRYIFLGHFRNLEDARQARKAAEVKYGFSPIHGEEPATVKPDPKEGRMFKLNTSGKHGVSFSNCSGKWVAYMNIERKKRTLGSFDTKEDAIACRLAAEEKYGYAPRKGTGTPAILPSSTSQ